MSLCEILIEEGQLDQHAFFAGLLPLLAEPVREEMVPARLQSMSTLARDNVMSMDSLGNMNLPLPMALVMNMK